MVETRNGLGIAQSRVCDYAEPVAVRRAVEHGAGDARLLDELGATVGNGVGLYSAMGAYRRGIDLCPRYTRGWVNVGTAYGNGGEHSKTVR